MTTEGFQAHSHQAVVHGHEHPHVTHHCKGGAGGAVEHLVATHAHEHNHAAVEHAHVPHQNAEREHAHECHIHDHSHPTES